MKTIIRIPTQNQYAFVEFEFEGSPEEAKYFYDEQYTVFNRITSSEGLSLKDWNRSLDEYLNTGKMKADDYAGMSAGQKLVIQEIKKSFKRLNK